MTTNRFRIRIRDVVVEPASSEDTGAFGGGEIIVPPPPPPPPPPVLDGFAAWSETLSITNFQLNTGTTVLQYINAQDSNSVSLGAPNLITSINDFSSNNYDLTFDATSQLVNLTTTNGVKGTARGTNASVLSSLSGNSWSNPYFVAIARQFVSLPPTTETLYCHGSSSADVYATLDVTSSGYLQYTYKDDSGNTLTATSSQIVPLDRKFLIFLFVERSKLRVFIHDGVVYDHTPVLTTEGAFNTTSTLTTQTINYKYANGSSSQGCTSGYYFGHVLAEGVYLNTFTIIEQSCAMYAVPFVKTDLSTLDNGIVSLIQGPGAGAQTTPKGDIVDIYAGTVFTASGGGTQASTTAGKFHNAIPLSMTASTVYMQGTVPAAWNVFSGSYGNFTLYGRFKTGTIDASTRSLFCLGSSTSTPFWRVSLNTSGQLTLNINTSVRATSTITCTSDTWYDVIIKYDGATYTFSVNNETAVTFTLSTNASVVGGKFNLGASYLTDTTIQHPGRGHLDCLALWNRALTSDEIIQLRNAGNGLDGFFSYLDQYEDPITPPSTASEFRGTQMAATTNNNAYMCGTVATGSGATYLSFIPPRSGRIRAITAWWKTDNANGYSAGNGGTYTLSIRTDSAGVPSGTVVAEQTGINGWSLGLLTPASANTAQDYKTTTLTTQNALVTAGTQYHLSIINTAASPNSNYASINTSDIFRGTNRALTTPTCSDTNKWALRYGTSRAGGSTPNSYSTYQGALNLIFHLDIGDTGTSNFWFGFPSASVFSGNTRATSSPFGGTTNRIRQKLPIVAGDNFTINAVQVALVALGNPGDVTARLLASNQTAVLGTAIISSSNYANTPITETSKHSWGKGIFASPIIVSGGATYYLELYSANAFSTTNCYYPSVIQDPTSPYAASIAGISGVMGGWYGTNGKLEASSNSGSTYGTYMSGNKDLSFYFEVSV